MKRFNLSQKTAIITGGCKGIGKAIALGLAEHNANIVITDKESESEGQKVIDEIKVVTSGEVHYYQMDVRIPEKIQVVSRKIFKHFKCIDILVNNAGIACGGPIVDMKDPEIQKLIDVNLLGVIYCCREFGEYFIKQCKGNVINIASTDAESGTVNGSVYSATKGGVISLTKALAIEWAKYSIRVNAVSPQVVTTDMTKERLLIEDEYKKSLEKIPLGRFLSPEDIQGTVIFLASKESSMITGHIIHIDGGYLAQ